MCISAHRKTLGLRQKIMQNFDMAKVGNTLNKQKWLFGHINVTFIPDFYMKK